MRLNISIKQKILGLAVVNLLIIIAISALSINTLNIIGKEIKEIAEEDIPLTEIVTKTTVHQLEQAIHFERALRYAELMQNDYEYKKKYNTEKKAFNKYNALVNEDIKKGEEIAHHAIEHALTDESRTEFEHVLKSLRNIEVAHKEYDLHALDAFKLFEAGKIHEAEKLADKIVVEEDDLDHELEALLFRLDKFTKQSALNVEHHEQKMQKILTIIAEFGLFIGLVLAVLSTRAIIKPISRAVEAMNGLADGDLETEIPEYKNKDEVYQMVQALHVFKENALQNQMMEIEAKKNEERLKKEREQAMQEMADKFESEVKSIVSAVAAASTELSQAAGHMKQSVTTTSERADDVASASEQTAANVQVVASAAEEMASSIQMIGSQVKQSNAAAEDTTRKAERADETLQSLISATGEISNITDLINDIAEQINLLALNATIESARAGEAGKGFAVVASEVKSLSTQVGKAVESVNEQIISVQGVSNDVVEALAEIKASIGNVNDYTNQIAGAVEEQNSVTNEIAANMETASLGAQEINSSITDVTHVANDASGVAEQVVQASGTLSLEAEKLSSQVDSFLAEIRSGTNG